MSEETERLGGHVTAVLADGAYDSWDDFDLLDEREIEAVVRMRKNANMKRRGWSVARSLAVKEMNFLGQKYWRFAHGYGRRWAVESAFSAIKRALGEAQRKAVAHNKLLMPGYATRHSR